MKTICLPHPSNPYFLLHIVFSCLLFNASLFLKSELLYAQCPTLTPVTLPFLEDFEVVVDTTMVANGELCDVNKIWSFETIGGRTQFGMDAPVHNGGDGALLLDNPGSISGRNAVILTLNMSNYSGVEDIYLVFDEISSTIFDYYYLFTRGSVEDNWIRIDYWQGRVNSKWQTSPEFNISKYLYERGQDFSSSFQIEFVQFDARVYYPFEGLVLDNIRISTCPRPSNLMVSNTTPNSTTMEWTEIGSATTWDIEWGIGGFTKGQGNRISGITNNSYLLSDLATNSVYDFYVRSDCEVDTSIWSGPFTFSTLCPLPTPVTLPFTEDFEETPNVTFNTVGNVCGVMNNWKFETTGGRARFGTDAIFENGGHGALFLANHDDDISVNYAIMTLNMSNYIDADNILLNFDFYDASDSKDYADSIWIRGSTTDSWIKLFSWQGYTENIWIHSPEFDIDSTLIAEEQSFSNNFQIRFGQKGRFSNLGLVVDNISLRNCLKPINLTATNLTATSATIGWQDLNNSTNWDIEFGLKGYIQGSGVKISGVDTNSYNLSNLIPSTSYDFYVRASCGDGFSSWVGPFSITTACSMPRPISLPFLEDFENIADKSFTENSTICQNFKIWDYEVIGGQAKFGRNSPSNNGGEGALSLEGTGNPTSNNAILTLNMSNYSDLANISLSYDFYDSRGAGRPRHSLHIRGSKTDEWVELYRWPGNGSVDTWSRTPELDVVSALIKEGQSLGNNFQIRFTQQNPAERITFDNILVSDCFNPDSLKATNITATNANLTWSSLGIANSWNIEWGIEGFERGTGAVIKDLTTRAYTIANLLPTTSFDFYVQPGCNEFSNEWSGPYTFTTLCSSVTPVILPFIEDFEDIPNVIFEDDVKFCREYGGWIYETNGGRARFGNLALRNGNGALTLDNLNYSSTNDAILTLDLSNYINETNLFLRFDYYDNNDADDFYDRIWIRGRNTDNWLFLFDWQDQTEKKWLTSPEFDVDAILARGGQSPSSSFQVRFMQKGDTTHDDGLRVDNIYVGTCPKPDSLAVLNRMTTSVDLSWKEIGIATTWTIEYGPRGYELGTGISITDIISNPYTLQNLEEGTFYDFYVRADCGLDTSIWAGPFTFNSACTDIIPVTLPFLEDFEDVQSATFTKDTLICFNDREWGYNTIVGQAIFGVDSSMSNGGSNTFLMSGYNDNNAILTLDMSNYIGEKNIFLVFDYFSWFLGSEKNDKIWIRGNELDVWIEVFDWTGLGEWGNSPEIDLDKALSVAGQTFSNRFQIRFGQQGRTIYSTEEFIIDNIFIGTCSKPQDLIVDNLTVSSTNLSWIEIGNAATWDIEWGLTGFTQGTGTLINNVDTTNYYLSGLTKGITYDFYVRSNCEVDKSSEWTGPFTFKTKDILPTNFIENFENFTNSEWEGNFWVQYSFLEQFLYEGWDLNAITPLIGNIESGDWLAFTYRYVNSSSGSSPRSLGIGDTLHIQVSTDLGETFTTIEKIHAGNHIATTNMTQLNFDLSPYNGEVVQFRFFAEWGAGDFYFLQMDDFFVGKAGMTIADATTIEGVEGSTADLRFNISLDTVYPNIITVDYTSEDSTATLAAVDYIATKGQLIFLPGEIDKEVVIPIIGDNIVEVAEVVQLKLSNPVLAILTDSIGLGFIEDDDFPNPPPPQTNANEDQLSICDTTAQLNAILAEMQDPLGWQIISGMSGVLINGTLPNATFEGVMGESYELEWTTINNPSGAIGKDTIIVSFNPDTDNDGVQDCKDICPNADDTIDSDGDTQPDACDCNPNDATDSLLVVTNNHPDNRIADSTYQSSVKLIGTGTVKNQSTVVFKAGQEILLNAGFYVEAGSNFHGVIAPCNLNEDIAETRLIPVNSRQNQLEIEASKVLKSTASTQMYIRPNLIQSGAIIQIDLSKSTQIALDLYNANGQKVRVYLKDIFWEAGRHQLSFKRGNLPAGIYFLQLQSEMEIITKKLMVQQ